jgi:transposase
MTHSNYTRNILNIEDENIIFEENCFKKVKIKNIETFVFHGTLTYKPEYCPRCGCINETSNDIINWGMKKNCKIKIPKVSNYNTLLILNKQRFFCKHCHSTFTASTSLVDYKKQISNNTRTSVILDLMTKDSEKNISLKNNISTNSTNRILDDISCDKLIKNNGVLPTSFGIDEFNATKDTISKLAFIIVDQDSKNIFDINNSRLSNDIYKYFFRYQKCERDKVKYITMDLYKPYYILMKRLFKNAILIPDRFHIVVQIRNALDKTRINLCKKSNPNYNKLKKYWKLILKNEDKLDKKKKKYSKHFKKEISQYDIVQYLINTDKTLKYTYNIYQGIIKSLDKRDKNKFLNIIHNVDKNKLNKYSRKAIKTLLNFEKYIINAFDYELSNGIVEGTNNVIKQLKHNACGYRLFSHFKARIMLIKGLYNPLNNIVKEN